MPAVRAAVLYTLIEICKMNGVDPRAWLTDVLERVPEHRLTVTNIRQGDPDRSYSRYVGSERNAPPEDCGGIPGFYEILAAIADPDHPNHGEMVEWFDDYDPDTFDDLPIKYALGCIANQRNAVKVRLAKKKATPSPD